MKNLFSIALIILLTVSCQQKQDNISKNIPEDTTIQKFEFDTNCFIAFNTFINDTIPTKIIFETGCNTLCVDLSFFNKYLNHGQKKEKFIFSTGFSTKKEKGFIIKNDSLKIHIGAKYIIFDEFYVFDFKAYNMTCDILLPIPATDSLTLWEFNLEKKYIKLHDYKENIIPKTYYATPILTDDYAPNDIFFHLPIRYSLPNGQVGEDTLLCLFDTGNPMDIFLWRSSGIKEKLQKQTLSDGILNDGRVKIFRTRANFFNRNIYDTTSIRFFVDPDNISSFDMVGINFMVRFNFFIDLYNKKLYYQPIEKPMHIYYKNGYETIGAYLHYDTSLNIVIDSIGAQYASGPCARAGVKEGDKLIWFCNYSIKELTENPKDFREIIHDYDCYHFRIVRNGDTLELKTNKIF